MIKLLVDSIKQLLVKPKMMLLLFAVSFIISLLIARPFYATLLNEADGSLILNKLVADFDYMIFTDFLQQSAKALRPFLSLITVMGLIYMLLNAFFTGGILISIDKNKFDFSDFMASSAKYFSKNLFLLPYLLILLVVMISFAGLFYFIFISIAEGGTEKDLIIAVLAASIILIFLISFVVLVGDYAKVYIYNEPQASAWSAFWNGFRFVLKFPKSILLFYLILFLVALVTAAYLFLENLISMHSGFTIFFMFIIQQIVAFKRIFLRTLSTTAAFNFLHGKQSS